MTATAEWMDERDVAIITSRMQALDLVEGVRVGDWLRFADGGEQRVSHVWKDDDWQGPVQTTDCRFGASWYLGHGYLSFSGGLLDGVSADTLTLTDERKPGSCWIFHHDYRCAGGGVDAVVPFRVYQCTEDTPT